MQACGCAWVHLRPLGLIREVFSPRVKTEERDRGVGHIGASRLRNKRARRKLWRAKDRKSGSRLGCSLYALLLCNLPLPFHMEEGNCQWSCSSAVVAIVTRRRDSCSGLDLLFFPPSSSSSFRSGLHSEGRKRGQAKRRQVSGPICLSLASSRCLFIHPSIYLLILILPFLQPTPLSLCHHHRRCFQWRLENEGALGCSGLLLSQARLLTEFKALRLSSLGSLFVPHLKL